MVSLLTNITLYLRTRQGGLHTVAEGNTTRQSLGLPVRVCVSRTDAVWLYGLFTGRSGARGCFRDMCMCMCMLHLYVYVYVYVYVYRCMYVHVCVKIR